MSDNEVTLEAERLRVVFFRRGDRWAHRIEVRSETAAAWRSAIESLEGSTDDVWPPSPPFQQLHVEDRTTGRVILLVGMAGRTHWSAAVEAGDGKRGLTFDVAARIQTPAETVGSAYRNGPNDAEGATQPVVLQAAPGTHVEAWIVKPLVVPSPPATIAWRYRVELRDES